MAGAEIIQIHPATHLADGRDIGDHHIIVTVGHHSLQYLDRQAFGRQVKAVQLPFQLAGQAGAAQFGFGEVDGHGRDLVARLVPAAERHQGVVDHDFAKTAAEAAILDRGQEFQRRDQAALGVIPAGQRLKPADFAGIGGQLRLEMGADLAFVQGRLQLLPQGIAVGAGAGHVGGIGADRAGAVAQRVVRSHLGGVEQIRAAAAGGAFTEAEADGAGHEQPCAVQADRG